MTLPFVSVCTPTKNRRRFLPRLIDSYLKQDYDDERMEWIIVDDGEESASDLVENLRNVRYIQTDVMTIGKKRNLMNNISRGDIIIYMDDDDYYPPERISHAVYMLTEHPEALCAGCTTLHYYYPRIGIFQSGPYCRTHATAGTFAFRRMLLSMTRFRDSDTYAEEAWFLHDFKIPLVQLDPMKTILCMAHDRNTVDKEKMLRDRDRYRLKETSLTLFDFTKDHTVSSLYQTVHQE